jgi:hypothetical protein
VRSDVAPVALTPDDKGALEKGTVRQYYAVTSGVVDSLGARP